MTLSIAQIKISPSYSWRSSSKIDLFTSLWANKQVSMYLKNTHSLLFKNKVWSPSFLSTFPQKRKYCTTSTTLPILPIGVQSFPEIVENQYQYIDKTQQAYDLITKGARRYFFSAPRRFGKSVLLSTLEQIFRGNRQLFKGLWIDSSGYTWEKYPIIKLDFSLLEKSSAKGLAHALIINLNDIAKEYGYTLQETESIANATRELVRKISDNGAKKVIVLIDEYDNPIIEHVEDIQRAKENIRILKDFFTIIKGLDSYIKFTFVTGITRFSHVTLFTGMNLKDISMQSHYGSLVGYTDGEIKQHLSAHVKQVAEKTARTADEVFKEMQEWYNGYRLSIDSPLVYNPWSVLNYLDNKKIGKYWFETGTPTFAIKVLKKTEGVMLQTLQKGLKNQIEVSGDRLAAKFEVEDLVKYPEVLLFQTGYLTIRAFNRLNDGYDLGFPNKEVSQSFTESLLPV